MRDRKITSETTDSREKRTPAAGRQSAGRTSQRIGVSPKFRARIQRRLLAWGRKNFASYPWRTERSPWISLAAEILLQRTRASQVAPIFRAFGDRYPTPQDLARESVGQLLDLTGSLGLRWRAPLMIRMAGIVADRGSVPNSLEELSQLPGVGPYAGAAYLSLHGGVRAPIVDSNVVRWLGRMFGFSTHPESRRERRVLELADRLTPQRAFRAYNYAVLDLSMSVCAKIPRCDVCPLAPDLCSYAKRPKPSRGTEPASPSPRSKTPRP